MSPSHRRHPREARETHDQDAGHIGLLSLERVSPTGEKRTPGDPG
jgi:hypothetical protein